MWFIRLIVKILDGGAARLDEAGSVMDKSSSKLDRVSDKFYRRIHVDFDDDES